MMRRRRSDNNGYAIVTVIIIIAFVSILATTLLYVSGMNFQMKAVDYNLKGNFYESEEYLEEVKAQLIILVATAADQAYNEVMLEAAQLRDADSMQAKFNEKYFNYIKSQWASIQTRMDASAGACYNDAADDARWDMHTDQGFMDIKGFHVHYTDSKNYTCYIDTDFRVTAPEIYWPVSEAKTTWDVVGGSTPAPVPETANYSVCVNYRNWVKR